MSLCLGSVSFGDDHNKKTGRMLQGKVSEVLLVLNKFERKTVK